MSQETPDQQPIDFDVEIPPEHETGVPADFAGIWHTPTTFVMDFVVAKSPPQQQVHQETREQRTMVPARVVARVRIPPEQVFEMARALTQQLDVWEKETGRTAGGHIHWHRAHNEAARPNGGKHECNTHNHRNEA